MQQQSSNPKFDPANGSQIREFLDSEQLNDVMLSLSHDIEKLLNKTIEGGNSERYIGALIAQKSVQESILKFKNILDS